MDGAVFDLGLSSPQSDSSGRGFSFRFDEPLDMRFDPHAAQPTAADLLNELSQAELEHVFWTYGEEPRGSATRPRHCRAAPPGRLIERTPDLVAAVTVLGSKRRIHPATRAFQALRIAVNDELGRSRPVSTRRSRCSSHRATGGD